MTLLFSIALMAQQNPIIPAPASIQFGKGEFVFNTCTTLEFEKSNTELNWALSPLVTSLQTAANINLLSPKKCRSFSAIEVKLSDEIREKEGYALDIKPNSISIKANSPTGVFYAVQSLLQLLPPEIESAGPVKLKSWKVPVVEIQDAPRFEYRGLMLDVARHYMPLDFIKKLIDQLARQKSNRFHWHLTDSQGWRFESKKYPRLTKTGAYRKGTPLNTTYDYDSRPADSLYGGYYTQEQMKEIVQYAKERFITVIPEIEMPAHSKSTLASYPELACLDANGNAYAYPKNIQDEFCTKEETFTFLTDILTELMEIFPSEYIHIAGDEALKENWKSCPHDIKRMKDEGLKDVEELQSYFVKRITSFVNSKGRKVIGWDEIMQGGLAPGATVMSWTGVQPGITAAKMGHTVVMSPGGYCYLDHYQSDAPGEPVAWGGLTTLSKTYHYEPVDSALNPDEARMILGIQGNLWTEFIPVPSKAAYMIFPREIAIGEIGWSDPSKKDYQDFIRRLVPYLRRLDKDSVNYSRHLFDLQLTDTVDAKGNIYVKLGGAAKEYKIHYTLDGTEPKSSSPIYKNPVRMKSDATVRAAVITDGQIVDQLERTFVLHKGTGKQSTLDPAPSPYYNKGGNQAWHNGSLGNDERFNDDEWLGWSGQPFSGTIDLRNMQSVSSLRTRFFHKPSDWIWMPGSIKISVSDNGKSFRELLSEKISSPSNFGSHEVKLQWTPVQTRYLKIEVAPFGIIPEGNAGAGNPAWLFADEMIID